MRVNGLLAEIVAKLGALRNSLAIPTAARTFDSAPAADIDIVALMGKPGSRLRIGVGGTLALQFPDGTSAVITYQSGDPDEITFTKILAAGSTCELFTVYVR